MTETTLPPPVINTCKHCGYQWAKQLHHNISRSPICPKCHATKWDLDPQSADRLTRENKARYMSKGKNFGIVKQLRIVHPDISLTDIAKQVGVSRERVRQILSSAGLPTLRQKPMYECPRCNKLVRKLLESGFCSLGCQKEAHTLIFPCDNCGKPVKKMDYNYNASQRHPNFHNRHFCNRRCLGEWMGKNYGSVSHPFKYDYEKVAALYNSGISPKDIALSLSMSRQHLYTLLSSLRKEGKLTRRAVTRYPTDSHLTIIKLYNTELSYKEMQQKTGLPISSIYSHIHRARKKGEI